MCLINTFEQLLESIIRRLKRKESYHDKWKNTYFKKKEVI